MGHPQRIHTGVSTKERARRRQSCDEDHRSGSRHACQHKPRIIWASRSFGEPKEVLYVEVLKAIYGMLEAALLWYKTFRKDLEDQIYFQSVQPMRGE
jgi:hypothetical protein